ncbi:hypothetical protein M0638_15775 [Roseomonas sp. NAR14]|uniref:Uncharacterized protein n=1 Tax=Roseomonas acroporae TaxID=2937791 RepID=A0A9X1Y982_9PROT|nr:hypothetical protein [Roseomonas acroporae]MCK8785838.1 hypothetical protein [Roseomonas acroporae]
MTRPSLLAAALLAGLGSALAAGGASAQVTYNGWNLGPDYGAMVEQQQRQMQMQQQQMQQQTAAVVQRTMQDPNCWAMYQQHRAQGGTLSYPQFAYQYAATGGFTAQGMQQYRQTELQNQRREQQSWQGVQEAERQRAQAQQQYADGYSRNLQESGRTMQGNGTWTDPYTGQQRVLPYMGPNGYTDPRTGQNFMRDGAGNYFAQAPNGSWYRMNPGQ